MVLGGGGARGAYAFGALSVLLPELIDQVKLIVGTSGRALIAAYLEANWHRCAEEAIDDGRVSGASCDSGTCSRR